MDRYLFRGLRADGEGWVYGNIVIYPHASYIKNFREDTVYGYIYQQEAVIPETVGQWTGLRDKWEQMIFEGDVVKVNHLDYIQYTGVVEYCNPVCAFKVSDHGYYNDFEVDFDYEVIGNIHDGAQ